MTDLLANQHPNIQFVRRHVYPHDKHREVHRFDRSSYPLAIEWLDNAEEWTRSPFVPHNLTSMVQVIHYTPHYFYAPTVPEDLKRSLQSIPNASIDMKFLIMLRNPIERAWSSYWFQNIHLFKDRDQGYFH